MSRRPSRAAFARSVPALCAPLLLGGCQTLGYYSQAVGGHFALMRAREPISEILAAEDTAPELREKLETLIAAREFAVRELALPDNDSYSSYVETGRAAVTWNVVAADEFSLDARTWCFPIAGCVSYRGYFDEREARTYAERLAAEEGLDVTVGGASAYSTLGWFSDPVLDTMLRGGDLRYVGTLFHELAHQRLYVKDDSDFNEAYASFVERVGVREWLRARGEAARIDAYEASLARGEDFTALLAETRAELEALYADASLGAEAMRERKASAFDAMRERYRALKASWDDYAGYDRWFARELNNARLVAVSTYRRFVPAFARLFERAGGDIERFHALAAELAELPKDERHARLEGLLGELRADARAAVAATSPGSAEERSAGSEDLPRRARRQAGGV